MRFAGYAAIFHRRDRGGDVILPGAFAGSLAHDAPIPLLWQHDPARRIGEIEQAAEDRRGLRVIGHVTDINAARMLRNKSVTGLSFGYRVTHAQGRNPRRLLALELVEISLVTLPMQGLARVHLMTFNFPPSPVMPAQAGISGGAG